MHAINVAVTNLGHDFGERMNGFDKRLVTEKEKWGETFQWVVKVVVKLLIAGCAPTHGGDSGHPLYLEDGDGKLILISQHHTTSSGTCFPRAFEVLRAFCAAHGDTVKEWHSE